MPLEEKLKFVRLNDEAESGNSVGRSSGKEKGQGVFDIRGASVKIIEEENDGGVSKGFQKLVKEIGEDQEKKKEIEQQDPNIQIIEPNPGFCVKTNIESGEKIFLNICHSPLLPSPPSISDEELAIVIANMDNSKFRIPMSIGTAHTESDNNGKPSRAFDVVLNSSVIDRLQTREGMKEFVIELTMCQIEAKNNLALNREYKVLRRRKSMGKLAPQLCRVKTKVQSISKSDVDAVKEDEETFKGPQPEYTMLREPSSGQPDFLIFEFKLPKLKSMYTTSLDCGDTRLVLHSRPQTYFVDLDLKWPVNPHETFAQFNRKTRILTVTCAVIGQAG
eukprot:m.20169 g.20169  ORF g.20169 m.20169 type:complete len:333 (-) comp5222_c2_seq1:372-1370(-)